MRDAQLYPNPLHKGGHAQRLVVLVEQCRRRSHRREANCLDAERTEKARICSRWKYLSLHFGSSRLTRHLKLSEKGVLLVICLGQVVFV